MSTPKKPHIAHTLLSRAQPQDEADSIFKAKVLERPLYLKPTTKEPTTTNARSTRQKLRQQKAAKASKRNPGKPRPLSAKQKRALQIYAIPKWDQKYEIYVPLWRMWCGYIREILGINTSGYRGFVDSKGAGSILASADFHGALVGVVRSRCVSRVGVRGIVVRDTKFSFEVVTERDEVKVVPKEHTVFRFEVPVVDEDEETENTEEVVQADVMKPSPRPKPLVFELYGENFVARAADRATRKTGLHFPPDL